jgi:hypothetical protein
MGILKVEQRAYFSIPLKVFEDFLRANNLLPKDGNWKLSQLSHDFSSDDKNPLYTCYIESNTEIETGAKK